MPGVIAYWKLIYQISQLSGRICLFIQWFSCRKGTKRDCETSELENLYEIFHDNVYI